VSEWGREIVSLSGEWKNSCFLHLSGGFAKQRKQKERYTFFKVRTLLNGSWRGFYRGKIALQQG